MEGFVSTLYLLVSGYVCVKDSACMLYFSTFKPGAYVCSYGLFDGPIYGEGGLSMQG